MDFYILESKIDEYFSLGYLEKIFFLREKNYKLFKIYLRGK